MEYDDKARWGLVRRDDVPVPRNNKPSELREADAVAWIERQRPIPWIGSVFSVPAPASFPSGFDVSTRLFDEFCPSLASDKEQLRKFVSAWPLERLFDAGELVGVALKQRVLDWFAERESSRKPTPLHEAVVAYCQKFDVRECVTTNWDWLLEKAFAQRCLGIVSSGVDAGIQGKLSSGVHHVYHPHGSFRQGDVVCSQFVESKGVPILPDSEHRAFLFLGYSGYEPSIYPHLERIGCTASLWCVFKREELTHLPAKLRLLSLRNTVVYFGDLRDLLMSVGCLASKVSLRSGRFDIDLRGLEGHREALDGVIRLSLGKMPLPEAFSWLTHASGSELTIRAQFVSDWIGRLILSRSADANIPLFISRVIADAPDILRAFHVVDQFGLWNIAHRVRTVGDITEEQKGELRRIVARSDLSRTVQGVWTKLQAMLYATVLLSDSFDLPDDEGLGSMAMSMGNKLLQGECAEVFGWRAFRNGETERAAALLDASATHYYVAGEERAASAMLRLRADLLNGTVHVGSKRR